VQVAAAPRLSRRHTVLVLLAPSFEEGVGALVTRGAAAVAAMQEGPRSGRSSPGETDGGGGIGSWRRWRGYVSERRQLSMLRTRHELLLDCSIQLK
jgi:hypothetical protein